ncbi:MAG: response regulator transcription factor [Chloroflexi bacterium]|nr:response regulator transcription factor [Chloroflexota bacterium]
MPANRAHILVVDDEPRYRKLIRFNLEAAGYRVSSAADGEEALAALAAEMPDLMILDLRLPGIDGFAVCERVREFATLPIIVLTALAAEADKVRGLRLGADDYVTKPFSAQELLARVEAVLRRQRLAAVPARAPVFTTGELSIDFAACRVTLRGQEVKLTATEYRLLQCLAVHPGRVLTQDELLSRVWGPEYRGQYEGLRVFIGRLRRKLEDDAHQPCYIVNRPGIGYCLAAMP